MESSSSIPTTENASPSTPAPDPKEVVEKILTGLGLEATVTRQDTENRICLQITTSEPGRLIGRRGQTLAQLQFLVNRILLRFDPKAPRVHLDCQNYRNRLRDDVLKKIQQAADKVRRWGEPVVIGPYNPAERRLIHEHFRNDPEIETVSETGENDGMKKMTLRLRSAATTGGNSPSSQG